MATSAILPTADEHDVLLRAVVRWSRAAAAAPARWWTRPPREKAL